MLAPAPVEWAEPGVELVWPKPPDTARIRYLRSLGGASDFVAAENRSGFMRWLTGAQTRVLPLVAPLALAADGDGRVWVADSGLAVVQVIDLARRRVDYIVQAGETRLVAPVGVAVDIVRQRLYVADAELKKVFALDLDGRLLQEIAPPEGYGRPAGLAVDVEGRLFVVDVTKARVEIFSPEGMLLKTLVSGAPPDYTFKLPFSVAVDRAGHVYVADTMNFRVEIFDPAGNSIRTIGQIGDVPGFFGRPRGVAVDSDGHIYVDDALFDTVQVFDASGQLLTYWGGKGRQPGQFSLPAGLCFDRFDRLYVADTYNRRIQVYQYLSLKN